jgi:hypothetical protein
MRLASLIHHHRSALTKLTQTQRSAANAITGCRTQQYGHLLAQCDDCDALQAHPHSCGHRSCPQCLNHCTSDWLDRQSLKRLPCDYYRDAKCGDHIGLTAILHTHTRRLGFHPHVHVVLPNGGLSKNKALWQTKAGAYLLNSRALATVFRARVLKTLQQQALGLPDTPRQWVAHCKKVGRGLPALQYLSRYLYRGVIAEKNILCDQNGQITFRYRDNKQQNQTRTLKSNDFLKLVLQHVLPKGFRRVRDYGYLHGNAKQTLKRVQWALQVNTPVIERRPRPVWHCKHCGGKIHIVSTYRRRLDTG